MFQIEDHITADERITLVILANRVPIAEGERDGNYYAPAPLEPGPLAPERNSDAVKAVGRLISGARLTSDEVQRLLLLAHVVDREITPGVVVSRPASGYEGRYGKLVTKLSMIAETKRNAEAES